MPTPRPKASEPPAPPPLLAPTLAGETVRRLLDRLPPLLDVETVDAAGGGANGVNALVDSAPVFGWVRGDYEDEGAELLPAVVTAAATARAVLGYLDGEILRHAPVHRSGIRGEIRVEPACPDCLGGLVLPPDASVDDPRPCGCWGLSRPVCPVCSATAAGPFVVLAPWPCATWGALEAVLASLVD